MKTLAFVLAVTCLGAGYASAQPPVDASGQDRAGPVLRYAELDLTHEQGARALIGRISLAAHAFCGPEPRPVSLGEYERYGACVRETTDAAVRRVNAPLVTAVHRDAGERMHLASR